MINEAISDINNKLLINAKRIVVKVGSAILSDEKGGLDAKYIARLAKSLSALMDSGKKVILVSSGAVSAGVSAMNYSGRPKTIPEKQAMASIGQGLLMGQYINAFKKHDKNVSQMLLTRGDMDDRRRYLNARYTLERLLEWGVLPIINENDTVTVDELRFGDNDLLSAIVAAKMNADLLIILTDVDGLFDSNPKINKDANLLRKVKKITPKIESLVGAQISKVGSGGMFSKVNSLKYATLAGLHGVLANGRRTGILEEIFSDAFYGTLFLPSCVKKMKSKKKWILLGRNSAGCEVVVDTGAEKALKANHKSLLPVGIQVVKGNFKRGDVIGIVSIEGELFAKGLTNYNSEELCKIAGKKSAEIEKILEQKEYDEAVHKDNLVVL